MTGQTLDRTVLLAVVEAAVRAPSLHNTQPWRFRLRGGALEVLADHKRRLPAADPRGWAMRIACGAAVLNARLAFAVAGCPAQVLLRPDPAQPDLLARLVPGPPRPATPVEESLFAVVAVRHTNRHPFTDHPVPAEAQRDLLAAARAEGAGLDLLIGQGPLAIVAEVVRAADTTLIRDAAYRRELEQWSRRSDADDGVPLDAGGPSPEPQDLLVMRDFGGPPRAPGRDFESDPLLAILSTAGDTAHDHLVAGQALQRVLLTATVHRLAVSLLSQPIEVPAARERLRSGLSRHGVPQMVLRIGYGLSGYPTRRRPVAEVIDE
jgi:nitroreductase